MQPFATTFLLGSSLLGASLSAQVAELAPQTPEPQAGVASVAFDGLIHTALGAATLDDSSGSLEVANLGSSGLDGVRIDLGQYAAHGLRVSFNGPPVEDGGSFSMRRLATLGPLDPYLLTVDTLTQTGDDLHVSADYSGFGSMTHTLRVYREGELEYEAAGQTGGATFLGAAALFSVAGVFTVTAGPCPPDEGCWRIDEGAVDIEVGGGFVVNGDTVMFLPDAPSITPDFINTVTFTSQDVQGFSIESEALALDGHPVAALGQALLTPQLSGGALDSTLKVSNLGSSGLDGVRVSLGAADSGEVTWDELDPSGLAPAGAYVELQAYGVLNGVVDASLGSVRVTKGTPGPGVVEKDYTVDFSSIGSPTHRVQILEQGLLVVDIPGHTGTVASASSWPYKGGKLGGALECFVGCHDVGTTFFVDGVAYLGDELRVLAEGASNAVYSKSALDVTFADVRAEREVRGISSTPAAWVDLGCALAGSQGKPRLYGAGSLQAGAPLTVHLLDAAPTSLAAWFIAVSEVPVPFKGGTLKAFPFILDPLFLITDAAGELRLDLPSPAGVPAGVSLVFQYGIQDVAAIAGVALSNAVRGTFP